MPSEEMHDGVLFWLVRSVLLMPWVSVSWISFCSLSSTVLFCCLFRLLSLHSFEAV